MTTSTISTTCPQIQLERVKHFFTHYKDLEPGKWAKIDRMGNLADARRVILEFDRTWPRAAK